jgi:hypothetical protein
MTVRELDMEDWAELVGTRWTHEELFLRLQGAWIPCLFQGSDLVATCVLRHKRDKGFWILETLRARKGFGTPLLRAVIPWLFDKAGGPFSLGYTWELSLPGLIAAWIKGWLNSAVVIQYGWVFANSTECSFCPTSWAPLGPRLTLPTLFQEDDSAAVVSDSGLGDGWGNVSVYRGAPDWPAIAKKGGWRSLWMRASERPTGWAWTGEFIVVGFLNYKRAPTEWVTAEVA